MLIVECDLAVLTVLAVAVLPALVLFALPTVLLVHRFLLFPALEAQARTDAKIGLLNLPTWTREAEAELSRASRTRMPLALAILDIDHFKAVNDTHGHLIGDKALQALADALTDQLRGCDRVGRYGGEEFVLLLPQTTAADARGIAERLRHHVASMSVPVGGSDSTASVRLTVSGSLGYRRGCLRADGCLGRRGRPPYYAKRNGRNMTHVLPPASSATALRHESVAVPRLAGGADPD
jgi:diguanylate cyclase (GGDEF)-like protein